MKKVEVYPAGFKVYDDSDNLIGYACDSCGEGFVYKDEEAFRDRPDDICYISEHCFDDYDEYIPLEVARQEAGETRNSIIQQVRDAWAEEYMLTDEQVEYYAEDVFGIAEWACIATYLVENFELDDAIEFDDIKGTKVFTEFQREAIRNGMSPKEYSERQLSYQEYAEICDEFSEAFIVDEDCEDDWSDKGLGTNALITYVEERRTGMIDGPDDFDCDDKWRKSIKR